jgi:hypothetical protein
MKKAKTEDTLKDFFDLELPAFKPLKRPESVFDSEIKNVFHSVDGLANSILFKNKVKSSKNTIFFPARHKKLSKAISIVSVKEAKQSIKKIKKMVGKGYTRRQLKASLILAGVRARALSKKPTISTRERQELKKVADVYLKGAGTI